METVRVVCPKCRVELDVKNRLNVRQKLIKCPNCGCQLMVRFRSQPMQAGLAQPVQEAMPVQQAYQQPQYQPPQYQQPAYQPVPDDGRTILAGHHTQQQAVGNTAGFLVYNHVRYPLVIGRNTIGRRSSTPQATVQIDTNGNNTMSRFHAVIETVRMADMSVRAIISNGSNKNSTFVSGVLLNGSDKLILKNGAEIKMGTVILRYELPV